MAGLQSLDIQSVHFIVYGRNGDAKPSGNIRRQKNDIHNKITNKDWKNIPNVPKKKKKHFPHG